MTEHMLSTIDNPYNPWTHYDEWYAWDFAAGYHTPGFLARIVKTSDALSDEDQDLAHEAAIEEIIHENVLGLYKRVPKA